MNSKPLYLVIHKSFNDLYFASGTEEGITAAFGQVRDDIKAFKPSREASKNSLEP
jgi:hypothetical protein